MSKYDFSRLQRVISKYHNIQVNREIAKKELKPSKKNIYKELLIKQTDTAQLILLKFLFFWVSNGNLEKLTKSDAIATIPNSWVIKPGDDIPQLAIIFRVKNKKGGGNYPVYIPHYNGTRSPAIAEYKKGLYGCTLVLKDNSKITIHASSYEVAERYIKNNLLKYVERKYHTNNFQATKRKVKAEDMEPTRADFYPNGKEGGAQPLWRHYF
ncbi:hypothetical protein IQ247_13750 [Plectonema cf. radiosum LEGE 06105]|uniref:Uncharacterized protein n=1 Tax=Plectonema cf. radiosum LEGE 06105 TaxID=945769 RepID=A0A8J7FHA6_9CYAN|nr:hypothetical protein [Plectonema radiosum]MBE9213716.1 hypothetical protein [Plectonema cf. radiosum LEGE 06105]